MITFLDKLQDLFRGSNKAPLKTSIYDYAVRSIDGADVSLSKFQGKPLLIVNTASRCGFTPQYESLQQLHVKFGDQLNILGFPSNNFMWQEPGSSQSIAEFCSLTYGVTFPMFEKIDVKGSKQHPLYHWLQSHSKHKVTWNFCKYLIDRNGQVAGFYPSKVDPMDPALVSKIQDLT